MRISFNPQISTNYAYKNVQKKQIDNTNLNNVEETKKVAPITVQNLGNVTKISFRGNFVDPNAPAIQFKVRGVSHHQKEFGSPNENSYADRNVERLADSDWKDGQRLRWSVGRDSEGKEQIFIGAPEIGELGRIPNEVTPSLLKLMKKHSKDFTVQLSNVLAGTTKGAATIGLRANLIYTGNDPKVKADTEKVFNGLLNSDKKDVSDVIMLYQPVTTPKQVLQKIFSNVEEKQGEDAANRVLDIVDSISKELTDPENKNILLLGHTSPDGDTIGCVLGLQAAIKANYPTKNVVCSIDDKIPGIYRDKLPGIRNITKPSDPNLLGKLRADLEQEKAKKQNFQTRNAIRTLQRQIEALENSAKMMGGAGKNSEVPEKYDLVVLMDVPSPSKFTGSYKSEIESAGKVIYIDHHRPRFEEWNAHKARTGIDVQQIQKDNLALVLPEVPATTELVSVIADNAGLLEKTLQMPELAKQFVASIVSGTSSDTGGFTRTANYKPSDMSKPVQERPNYYPEGLAKWLIEKLGNTVNKKWIRENIVYDLPDKKLANMPQTSRGKMIDYCLKSQSIYPKTGFGAISLTYEQMQEILDLARMTDREVTFDDVQKAVKYSEVMSALQEAPGIKTKQSKIQPYKSPYQDDKISCFLLQDKKEGCLDELDETATENSIRLSFRSQEGTLYSLQLASAFDGGGHGSAAGARITLEGLEMNSPLAIKVITDVNADNFDKKDAENYEPKYETSIVYDPAIIYKAVIENEAIKDNLGLSQKELEVRLHKFEPVIDAKGKPIVELINGLVEEIRDSKPKQE